jgi:hypothetical protein
MKRSILLISATISLLFVGCQSTTFTKNNFNSLASVGGETLRFTTNKSTFIRSLEPNISKGERNEFIDEFILKSDVQCQQYLENSKKDKKKSKSEGELYMNIAHTVSSVLGLGYITQTAQSIFLDNPELNTENQKAYENALSPEIKKGVEIVRERYAKKMKKKKIFPVKKYGSNHLKKDMSIYDKQCNKEYGLIEINRALKEMQRQMRVSTYAKPVQKVTPKINLEAVKKKVKAVSEKVKKRDNHTTKKR